MTGYNPFLSINEQQAVLGYIGIMNGMVQFFGLFIVVFMFALVPTFISSMRKQEREMLKERRKKIEGYEKLPPTTKRSQEELWSAEIRDILYENRNATWRATREATIKSLKLAAGAMAIQIIYILTIMIISGVIYAISKITV